MPLLLASVGGAALGWERELQDKPAGLRTHMMVSLGAAAFMVTALQYVDGLPDTTNSALRVNPLRVLAYIIGGVGFLGAGTIIEARHKVYGITTAASIWVAAAIGVACGMSYFTIAATAVIFALGVLTVVGGAERLMLGSKGAGSAPRESQ